PYLGPPAPGPRNLHAFPTRRSSDLHKAEYFSAVLEGVLIVVAALLIVNEAIGGLMAPERIEAPVLGLAVNGSAAHINAVWAAIRSEEHTSEHQSREKLVCRLLLEKK